MALSTNIQRLVSQLYKLLQKLWDFGYTTKFAMVITVLCAIRNNIYMTIYRKYYKLPNGPNGVPILGMIPYSRLLGPVKWNGTVVSSYGPLASYPMGTQMFMMINDPTVARNIYSSKLSRNRFEPFLDKVSNTITFLNGEQWYQRRKNIHSNLITMLNTEFVTKGSVTFLQNVLFPYLDKLKQIHQLKPILSPLTTNLVLYGCVGHHLQSMNDPFFIAFDKLVQQFWNIMRLRIFIAWVIGQNTLYNILFKKFINLSMLGENIRTQMVDLVIGYVKQKGVNKIDDKKLCFYDLMKKSAENTSGNDKYLKLTDNEIYSDITALLQPSVDTSANTGGFVIFLLCKYPDMQQMIYEKELKIVFEDNTNNIDLSQINLQKLVRFRAFIHEAMRIYPTTMFSAPHFVKNYDEKEHIDEKIKINLYESNEYYELPTQCHFAINTIAIHRNAKFWVGNRESEKDINMMEPHLEFWIDENGKFKWHKSLCVFSFGKRECVGKQVAIKNLYVILSALMMRYKFSVDKPETFEIPADPSNLLTPGKATINIKKRKV